MQARALTIAMLLGLSMHSAFAATPITSEEASSALSSRAAVGLDKAAALRTSQAVVGRTIGNYTLRDREAQLVQLSRYRGKPLLVNFVYTGCFEVCPTSTRALLEGVKAMRERFGENQFNVISIGFNQPMDSPQALKVFAAQHRIGNSNWEFLSPTGADVAALAADFGFSYVATPAGFDHILQVSIVDARGVLYRQIYGDRFPANLLGDPLKQLLANAPIPQRVNIADLIDRVRILCSVYDPVTGKYRVSYGLVIEIAGGATFVVAMLWFALAEWRARRLQRAPNR